MNQLNPTSTTDILTEQELLGLLGMKKSALNDLRLNHQFPFCKISNTVRIYLVQDVLDFVARKRVVLNLGSDTDTESQETAE